MSMDKFTAEAILNAALTDGVDNDAVADLYKTFSVEEGGPSEEAQRWYSANSSARVQILDLDKYGQVVGLNKSTSGLYPGSRYPIYVKLDGYNETFEYDETQLTVVN